MLLIPALLPWCCGCPSTGRLPSQAPVVGATEEQTQRSYLLYVPSSYSDKVAWPLVVACHGTWPYDTAKLQMQEWAEFAEHRGIIVAAPDLVATKGDFPPPAEKQIALQKEDEQAILAIVGALKRKYSIAEDRVFLTGWSAGAYTILYTGLRHPDVFRAMAIRQGSFEEQFMEVPKDRQDRWQRILVIYGMADLLRDQSKGMVKWLRDQGWYVDEEEMPGSHRRIDPGVPWKFFSGMAKETPWVRVRSYAADAADPRVIRFGVDTSPALVKQQWSFGDGNESSEASPIHTYAQPGRYEVSVSVELKGGKKYTRRHVVQVSRY
jgi:dienelactone hydrolase